MGYGWDDVPTCPKCCPRMVSIGPQSLLDLYRHLQPHRSVIGASQAPGFTAHKPTPTSTFMGQIGAGQVSRSSQAWNAMDTK